MQNRIKPTTVVNVVGIDKNNEHFIYLFTDENKREAMMRVCRHAFNSRYLLTPQDAEMLCDRMDDMC